MAVDSSGWIVLGISWACQIPRLSLEKQSRAQTPRVCGGRRLKGLGCFFSLLRNGLKLGTCLLGAGRLMAPHFCFSSSSSETTESLLKGDTWTMVRALESSGKSSWSEHSLRPTVFV